WATCGVPAPLRIRPGTLAGLASLPSWAASLDRPYLHSLAEAREASREIETRSSAPHLEAVLGTAQVADWLGCEVVARSPLTALVFPELRGDARGFGVDLLPPDEVARRLAEHRYGASLPADREPTLFESLRGGRAAIGTDLPGRVAATVPGFVVRLGQDAHLDPGFDRDLLERLGVSSDGGESARTGGASRSSRGPRAPSLPVAAPPSLEHIRRALGWAPESAYTTPLVYPWSVQHFEPAPRAPRTPIGPGPFRLYVHVPFCRYHCSFCFYAVRTGAGDDEKARYVDAVLCELEAVEPGTPLSQLFVGGGTPTTLPPGELSRLLGAIFERAPSRPGRVHTIEASPDSLTPEHLDVLEDHGVRRISMGIESLDDSVLAKVSRRHGAAQALEACRLVLERGIALNVDLIYGLPGQTHEGFRRDLERAVDAG
ncbi:MAG: radical SAM protein, partial [Alphaproteobacteria bacterium]